MNERSAASQHHAIQVVRAAANMLAETVARLALDQEIGKRIEEGVRSAR